MSDFVDCSTFTKIIINQITELHFTDTHSQKKVKYFLT